MKKTLLISLFAVVSTVLVSGFILSASAQESSGFLGGFFGGGREQMIENKAEALGLPAEDLQAKLDDGMRFPEIIEESGITHDEMRERMHARKIEGIDNMVAEEKISAEYGEELKQTMEERTQSMGQNGARGKGMGGGSHSMSGERNCDHN